MCGTNREEGFRVAPSDIILVAAPDSSFRRSLAFALESDGFRVYAHGDATEAFASAHAGEAACACIDDEAISDWDEAREQFGRFAKPVILLIGIFGIAPELPFMRPVVKPFLGEALIEAVRGAIADLM